MERTARDLPLPGFKFDGSAQADDEATVSDNKLAVYPNPASDFINVYLENGFGENAVVRLFDMNGRKVFELSSLDAQNNLLRIETEKLDAGLYILSVENSDAVLTKQISIVK